MSSTTTTPTHTPTKVAAKVAAKVAGPKKMTKKALALKEAADLKATEEADLLPTTITQDIAQETPPKKVKVAKAKKVV